MSEELRTNLQTTEEDAETIRKLSQELDASFDNLMETYQKNQQAGMDLEWAEDLGRELANYRNNQMAEATTSMNQSAQNINTVNDELDRFSKQDAN